MNKRVVNILTRLCGSLKENELVTLGEIQTFLICDLSFRFKVFLVTDEHNGHPLVSML